MTLAIAAPSFSRPSETFIRSHAATILPNDTVLLCQDGRGSQQLGYPVLSNIDPYPAPLTSTDRLSNTIRFRWRSGMSRSVGGVSAGRVREFFQQHNVSHCLAEFGPTGCLLRRATSREGIPLFVHFHGFDATQLVRQASWLRHYARLFKVATGVIAPSQFIAKALEHLGCPPEKLHVSPCGIEPSNFVETTRTPGRVLAVGRFVEKKAPLHTIRAFSQAAHGLPEAHLDMVGDGPLMEAARVLIAELGIGDRITLHGAQPHAKVQSLFKHAAVFVQHSVTAANGDTEGLPVSVLEAMASSIPVVSTLHSGIPEVVVNGTSGVLVEEHDVDGMANAMRSLLVEPDVATEMGRAGAPTVRTEFSHEATAARLRKIMGLGS